MKNASVKNAFRSLLAAWTLLALSMSSATFVHCHSGGCLSHGQNAAHDSLAGSVAPVNLHDDHEGTASLSVANVHHHGFVTLLGTLTCLPASGGSTVPHDESPCNWCCWIATASTAEIVRPASESRVRDPSGPPLGPLVLTIRADSPSWHETLRVDLPRATLLCDRARHERSGVQLA
jgi:hypothetical protein